MLNIKRFLTLSFLVVVGFSTSNAYAEDVQEMFDLAVAHTYKHQTDEARILLEQILAENPTGEQAHEMRERVGPDFMAKMVAMTQLGDGPDILFRKARVWELAKRDSADEIATVVDASVDTSSAQEEVWEAANRVVSFGQYAMPRLLDHMGDSLSPEKRAMAISIVKKIGVEAIPSLCEAVKSGTTHQQFCATMALSSIAPRDVRSAAAIKSALSNENVSDELTSLLEKTLAKNLKYTNKTQASTYAELFAWYMSKSRNLLLEVDLNNGIVWHITDGQLKRQNVPSWAWASVMAEKTAYDGLRFAPNDQQLTAALAASIAAQVADLRQAQDSLAENDTAGGTSDKAKKAIETRASALALAPGLLDTLAAGHLYDALDVCLKLHNPSAAIVICEALGRVADGTLLPRKGTPLYSGESIASMDSESDVDWGALGVLDSETAEVVSKKTSLGGRGAPIVRALLGPNAGVRYAAAMALAQINPKAAFLQSDKVAPTLALAIGEAGPLHFLLVCDDADIASLMRQEIEAIGYSVSVAENAIDAKTKASSFPPQDAILIWRGLSAQGNASSLVKDLSKNEYMSRFPIAIITTDVFETEDRGTFNKSTSYIRKGMMGKTLTHLLNQVSRAGTTVSVHKANAEKVAVAAAETLASVSAFGLDNNSVCITVSDAGDALSQALDNRSDSIRLPAIKALGNMRFEGAVEALNSVATAADNPLALRIAALDALKRIASTSSQETLENILASDGAVSLRLAAASAISALKLNNEARLNILRVNRLEKAAKEE